MSASAHGRTRRSTAYVAACDGLYDTTIMSASHHVLMAARDGPRLRERRAVSVRGDGSCLESLPILLSDLVRVHPGRPAALPTATGWDEELLAWTAGVRLPRPGHSESSFRTDPSTHVSELLGTRLGLLASICLSTTRTQVMTRL